MERMLAKACTPMNPHRKPLISKQEIAEMARRATHLWHQGQYSKYFDAMERVARIDPPAHRVAIDIGAAYAMRYDYPAAERWFERAVATTKNKSEALAMIGLQ